MKYSASFLFAALACTLGAWPLGALAQQTPTVMIDGSPMAFSDQPPVDQAGRIFVPMRAIFERLGATVVYENGTINATRGHRTVQLQIGSANATVNGQQVMLDAPPFEIDNRTLVPLRFVSQALGANVAWNESQLTAYIRTNGMGESASYQRPAYQPSTYGGRLFENRYPLGDVSQRYPTIDASFRQTLRPDSVIVRLDGHDVTGIARVTPNGFRLTPDSRLYAGTHSVEVIGVTESGERISDTWDFTVVPQ